MEYLKCLRCGLELRVKPARVQIEHCPRCLARSATVSPLASTAAPAASRSAAASRRASLAALAASVRDLRSPRGARPAR